MKRCSRCRVNKLFKDFNKNGQSKDGYRPECKECRRGWREENREKISAQRKAYRLANKEKIAQQQKEWRIKNVAYDRATSAQWRKDNPERFKEQMRNWRAKNKQRKQELEHRRRARKLNNGVYIISPKDMRKLSGPCFYCESIDGVTMDHIIPISRGGTHSIGNLVPACKSCNSSKGDKLLVEWKAGRPRPRATTKT